MSWDAWSIPDPKEEQAPTWGDYGKAAGSTVASMGAGAAGLLREFYEQGRSEQGASLWRNLQGAARTAGEDIQGSMTDEGRSRFQAGITSETFWKHPFSSLALKGTGMVPYVVASAIPGVLVGEGAAALAATAAAGGTLGAGDVVESIYAKTDKMSDEDLKEQSTLYRGLRADTDETEARREYNQTLLGMKPAIAFALGVGSGAFGPAGNIVKGIRPGATAAARGAGVLGHQGVMAAAGEGAVTELAEEGYGAYAGQKAEIEGGLRQKYDAKEIFDQALTGAVLGAGFGGVSGIGGGKGKAKADEIRAAQEQRRGEEGAAAQVPAGEAGIAAGAEAPPTARDQAAASKKGVTFGVDPAVKAALDAEQAPAPPTVNPAEAAVPPTPEPPAPPVQPPVAAQPPQAPTPPQGPAAGPVTPEVTAPLQQPAAVTPTAPPTDTSALTTQTVTPEVTAPAQVATAPGVVTPAEPAMPSAPAQVATAPVSTPTTENIPATPATPATPAGEARAPRVLQDISQEGKGKQKAQAIAQAKREKAATAEPVEKVVGKKKLPLAHKMSQEERAAHASRIFGEETTEKLEIPDTPEKRKAMALKLKPVVDRITAGIEPRENLPQNILDHYNKSAKDNPLTPEEHARYHRSLPGRVGDKDMSPHVRYLREAVDVQNLLEKGKDLGPKSKNYRRVLNFIAATNEKSPDLITMSRKEAGEEIATSRRGGTAEQGESTQAKIEAGGETKGAVKSAVSEGAAAPGKVLEGEAKAKAAAEVLAKIKAKAAAAVEPAKAEPAAPAPKKEMPKKVAEKVAITKSETKITEEVKPEPKPEPTKPDLLDKITGSLEKEYLAEKRSIEQGTAHSSVVARHKIMEAAEKRVAAEQQKEEQQEVTPEVTEKPADVGEVRTTSEVAKLTPHERILQAKADKAEAEALAAREKAAAERKAKAKPRATPEQVKAALEKMKADKVAKAAADAPGLLRMSDEPGARQRVVEFSPGDKDVWDSPLHKARDLFGHDDKSIGFSGKVSEVLRGLNLDHLQGEGWEVPKYIADFTRRRLTELLGHMDIHFASADLMLDASGGAKAPYGYFHPPHQGRPGYIVIQAGMSAKDTAHVVIHEALHAVLHTRINSNSHLRTSIEGLMKRLSEESSLSKFNSKLAAPALKDVHEFVSEALSNPRLQQLMQEITVPTSEDVPGSWKPTLWNSFVGKVRKMMGLPVGSHNLLSETLKLVSPELQSAQSAAIKQGTYQAETAPQIQPLMDIDKLKDAAIGKLDTTSVNTKGKLELAKDKISRLWDMGRRGAQLYGPSNPLYRMFETRAMMERAKDTILKKYGGLAASAKLAIAERTHPEAMRLGKEVYADASLHDVNLDGSNDHLGKDKLMGVQAKNEIARLKKQWNDPRLDPVRDTLRDAMKFFKDIHNAVSRETINNILAEANIHDKALAERIHMSGLTEADRTNFANTKLVSALDQVAALKHRHGSFMPFRRYGDYISAAEHELSVPANATKINDNTLQFLAPNHKNMAARAMVKAYLRSNSHTPQGNQLTPHQIQKVWVDKNNPTKLMEGTEPDAVPAYRVAMQTAHVEMHETRDKALASQKDLTDAGLLHSRTHKREEAYRTETTNIQAAMGTVLRSLEKQQRYIDADPTQKAAMREMFHDLSIGLSGTTSIKNSMRQRRNVAGMSKDLGRVTADYSRMTANHLALLQYRPKLDAILKEMRDYNDNHPDDKNRIRREEVYKEFVDRIYGKAAAEADKHTPGVVSRVLQVTRLSFLAGPSFHLINAHEPWTTALPVIGGDHGMARTAKAITGAYNLIGGRAGVIAGLKDTAAAYTKDTGFTDYVKLFKDTITKNKTVGGDRARRLTDLLDYADARNLFSNSSIFEQAKFANPEGNIAGKALDRADLMANQVGTAIEAINRSVTLIPAYELQYKKNGGNHEAAMHYAFSKAQDSMGDYSAWNAAPAFNSKYGKPFLQFKKFPQKTYMLLGNIMGGVLKGDPAAMKQFAGLMVTHGLVAGALGMPTEPFKLALIAANALGITGFTPEDYEYAVRQLAARVAGQKGGEIISKGLYRGLGIELSGRVGLDSLLVRGAPKGTKDKDIKEFLFDTMAGASGSFLLNQVQGAQAAFKGDFATAVEKISPLRTVGDITKAAVGLAGEKKGPSGKTTQEQFTPWEAGVRALGFTPSSAAEMGALRGTQARESRRLSANRSEIVNAWVDATGADKVKVQRMVQEFNAGRPKNEQISQKDLTNAASRRLREAKVTEHGITTSKRTRAIDEMAKNVFNP